MKVSPLYNDLCSVLYNRTFKTILCVGRAGNVAIYNIEDGSDSNRFMIPNNTPLFMTTKIDNEKQNNTHKYRDSKSSSANFITMACLDGADKRLIIYTQIGVVQFWNFTTGTLLFEVNPQVPTSMGTYKCMYVFINVCIL